MRHEDMSLDPDAESVESMQRFVHKMATGAPPSCDRCPECGKWDDEGDHAICEEKRKEAALWHEALEACSMKYGGFFSGEDVQAMRETLRGRRRRAHVHQTDNELHPDWIDDDITRQLGGGRL